MGRGVNQDRVSIRSSLRHRGRSDRAAGAATVVDDDGLTQALAELVGDGARDDVGRTPRGEGHDRAVRFISWDADIGSDESVYITDYVFVLRMKGQPLSIVHEQHVQGLFSRAEWLALLADVGFHAQIVIDSYEREVFVATKPASASCSET